MIMVTKAEMVTRADVRDAVEHLATTQRGSNAMRRLLGWFDDDGLGLDEANQRAVFTVLSGAWNGFPGSARDFLREYL